MKFKTRSRFFLFLFIFCSVSAFTPTYIWVLQKKENGIAVYTRPMKGYNFKEVRVVNKVKSSLTAIVALLLDTKNYPKWQYGCKETSTLKVFSEQEIYNYQITDLPWPLSDRDVVAHFLVTQDPITKVVTFSKTGMENYIPEQEGMVRVLHFQSITYLTPINKDSVQIILEMHLDAGGNIPDWVVNENVVGGPYSSTLELTKRISLYNSAKLSFIKELSD